MSVDLHRTTRHYIPEDRTLYNHRCENLKSYRRIEFTSYRLFLYNLFQYYPQICLWLLDGFLISSLPAEIFYALLSCKLHALHYMMTLSMQCMNYHTVQLSAASAYFLPLPSKYSAQNSILKHPQSTLRMRNQVSYPSKKQEVLGRTNRLLALIRHGPHWKRRVQKFFYRCVCIRYRGNVYTEPFPSNNRGIFTELLPSNDRGDT
jgi:hypothetical protein